MFVLILLILILMILHLLCLRGRKNQPGMETLRGWFYAHRGLHDDEKPENSLAAYKAALDKGYGIEFDVHLLKDGSLAVMHDSDLKRTTGREGFMEDLTAWTWKTIIWAVRTRRFPHSSRCWTCLTGRPR